MPFIIALQAGPQPMFFQAQPDGTMLLTPSRDKATRFPEERADMLATAHNIYTTPNPRCRLKARETRRRWRREQAVTRCADRRDRDEAIAVVDCALIVARGQGVEEGLKQGYAWRRPPSTKCSSTHAEAS
jgi:hypothetical protein